MAQIEDLGLVMAIKVSATAPINTAMLWRDISLPQHSTKIYNNITSQWEVVGAGGGGNWNNEFTQNVDGGGYGIDNLSYITYAPNGGKIDLQGTTLYDLDNNPSFDWHNKILYDTNPTQGGEPSPEILKWGVGTGGKLESLRTIRVQDFYNTSYADVLYNHFSVYGNNSTMRLYSDVLSFFDATDIGYSGFTGTDWTLSNFGDAQISRIDLATGDMYGDAQSTINFIQKKLNSEGIDVLDWGSDVNDIILGKNLRFAATPSFGENYITRLTPEGFETQRNLYGITTYDYAAIFTDNYSLLQTSEIQMQERELRADGAATFGWAYNNGIAGVAPHFLGANASNGNTPNLSETVSPWFAPNNWLMVYLNGVPFQIPAFELL